MRTRIKICGITNLQDALLSIKAGVDALGFVISSSPRQIKPEIAHAIISELPPIITTVGVFVDESVAFVKDIVEYCKFSCIQLQGNEHLDDFLPIKVPIIKSYKIKNNLQISDLKLNEKANIYLFDKYNEKMQGGTSEKFDWNILREKNFLKPFILAGGLSSKNVANAIYLLQPYAVDVSSGIEKTKGIKDGSLINAFVREVQMADFNLLNKVRENLC